MPSNIEKSAFRRGEYVGYANGVWRIKRDGKAWTATRQRPGAYGYYCARTLKELSNKIATA